MWKEIGFAFSLTVASALGGCTPEGTNQQTPTAGVQPSETPVSSLNTPCEPFKAETDATLTLAHEEISEGNRSCTYDTYDVDAEAICREAGIPFETTAIDGTVKTIRSQENSGAVSFERTIYCSGPEGATPVTLTTNLHETPLGRAQFDSEQITKP